MAKKSKVKIETPKKTCSKCQKEKKLLDFYNCNNLAFGDGKAPLCKLCVQDYIDINDLDSVYEVLQLLDIPFDYHYWELSLPKPNVIGNYIKFANSLPQLKGRTFKDSVFPDDEKLEEIQESAQQSSSSNKRRSKKAGDKYVEEDKVYSKKWLGHYTPTEIDYLESYLTGLHNDFKIVTESHRDYAKKIAKASLHMDNCFQDMLNGKSGADKKYKDAKDVFDTLSKSAQFSESVRGANDVGLGCFGKVFDKVEQRKWIPQHTPLEEDVYDRMLNQFNTIQKSV